MESILKLPWVVSMYDLSFLLPEIILVILSFGLLINSMVDQKDKRITNKILLIIGSILSMLAIIYRVPEGVFMNGTFENNSLTNNIKLLSILGTLFGLLFVSNSKTDQFKEYFNEYCFLLILSLVGGMLVVSSREFFTMIIAFELLSIPIYLVSAMGPNSSKSIEAATKLFFFGTLSTVFLIFSSVLFYSLSGSTLFVDINWVSKDYLLVLATILLLIPISFKCALYPFHFWVPDTYESAPMNILPFLSTIPKISIIAFIFFFFNELSSSFLNNKILNIIVVVSLFSMLFGSILSIKQNNLFRLLAYSGIPHAGIMLICSIIPSSISSSFLILYFTFYIFSNIGLYIALNSLPKITDIFKVEDLKGLYKDSPFLALSITCFLLSLAGAPLFVGFWGKFNIAIISYKTYGLLIPITILISAGISFYYYLRIISNIFSSKSMDSKSAFTVSNINKILISLCVFVAIFLGINPNFLKILM